MEDRRPGRSSVRIALVSGTALIFVICAMALVLFLGSSVVPFLVVDINYDDYSGPEQEAVMHAVGEMYRKEQGGLGTYRVTIWKITGVEKCRTRCPRPYAVRLKLYTLFGIPYGETGVSCGPSGPAEGSSS